MNPLDELFREKLNAHKVQPSVDAWSRVEKNISKKNSGWATWLRAASVVFILGAGFIVYSVIDQKEPTLSKQVAAVTEPQTQKQTPTSPNVDDQGTQSLPEKTTEKKSIPPSTLTAATKAKRLPLKTQREASNPQPDVKVPVTDLSRAIALVEEKPIEEETPSELEKAATDKAMVVVYTLELPAQSTEVIAGTTNTGIEKKTGLKRVLELAREARNTENPIGELRQAKDELLAFNFSRDREQRNDK